MGTAVHGGSQGAAGPEYSPHCHRDGQHDCKAHTQGDSMNNNDNKTKTTKARGQKAALQQTHTQRDNYNNNNKQN